MIDISGKIYWVYIVQCSDGSYYTGIAIDVVERVRIHNKGTGAKYTRSRLPVKLLAKAGTFTRGTALSLECTVKKLDRNRKVGFLKSCRR